MSDDSISWQSLASSQSPSDERQGIMQAGDSQVGRRVAIWRRLLLGVVVLEIPLQLDTYLFHDLDDAQFGAISGFNISITTFCLALLYLQWLPRTIVESAPVYLNKWLTALLALTALSVLWAANRERTLFELFLLLQAFLIFAYIANNVSTRSDIMFVLKLLLIGLAFQGALMVATRVIADDIRVGPVEFRFYSGSKRVTGSFGSPNVASSFIALLFAPALSLLVMPVSRKVKLLSLAAVALGGLGLVLTMSRGGWLAAAVSVAIFGLFAIRNGWMSKWMIVVMLILTVALIQPFSQMLSHRLFGDDGGSALARLPLVELSRVMVADHPLGVGANNWDVVAGSYAQSARYREAWFYLVHNKYLLVLAELGWLGLIAFAGFLVSILTLGWRAYRRTQQFDKSIDFRFWSPLAIGLTAAFLGQTIHMSFDIFNSRAQIQMICLVAALICSVFVAVGKSADENPQDEQASIQEATAATSQ